MAPLAPPARKTSFGLPDDNTGYFAVFGLLAVYALVGWTLYAGGVAAVALAVREVVQVLMPSGFLSL